MANLFNFASSKVISVLVGPDKKAYTLHKDLLCAHSPFFQKCLESSFLEKKQDQVELPEDSPEVFEHFINWIYREDVIKPTDQASLELAIQTYVFADKLCMTTFKNRIMTRIRAYHETAGVHLDSLALWRSLDVPDKLPLERFLFDMAGYDMLRHRRKYFLRATGSAKRGDVDSIAEENGPLVADLLWTVLQAANQKIENPATLKGCQYHEHAEDEVGCPDIVPASTSRKKRPSTNAGTSRDDLAGLLRGLGLVYNASRGTGDG